MIENIGAYSQVDYDRGYQQGRADAIDECIVKVCGLLAYYEELTLEQLFKTNVENELHFLMNDLEQLKEQNK